MAVAVTGVSGQAAYRLEADGGASRIAYDAMAPLDAGGVGLLAELSSPSLFGRVTGGWTGFEGGSWSTQGSLGLSGWTSPNGVLSPLRLEIGGSAAGSHHSSGFDTAAGRLESRVHVLGNRSGAWAGMGLATAKNTYDSTAVSAWLPGVGAWMQTMTTRASASFRYARVDGRSYPEVSVSFLLTRGPLDLTLYAGAREWPGDDGTGDELWAGGAVAYWITPRVALTAAGGAYGVDVLQGLPGADFFSVGLRWTPRRRRPVPVSAAAPIVYTAEDVGRGGVAFEVDGAERVEIAGDWTGWELVPLTRSARGRWVLPAALDPGVYRFNLRVDGERWMVPEGFPTVDDGFGGKVGLLLVAEPGSGV